MPAGRFLAAGARLGYAFLLAFVFPFICWGQSVQAGHPHLRPHFVFAQPSLAQSFPAQIEVTGVEHRPHSVSVDGDSSAKEAAGQATPATLALFLLLLLVFPLLWPLYQPKKGHSLLIPALGTAQSVPALPLPPPRTAG